MCKHDLQEYLASRTLSEQQMLQKGEEMKKTIIALVGAALMSVAGFAIGHSGGTDAAGCHKDHSTGDYHCHKPK